MASRDKPWNDNNECFFLEYELDDGELWNDYGRTLCHDGQIVEYSYENQDCSQIYQVEILFPICTAGLETDYLPEKYSKYYKSKFSYGKR